jgi:hypothetical protein
MVRRHVVHALLVIGLLAVGCSTPPDGEPGSECDPACAVGETCVDGVCEGAVVECDPACAVGETCVDGVGGWGALRAGGWRGIVEMRTTDVRGVAVGAFNIRAGVFVFPRASR